MRRLVIIVTLAIAAGTGAADTARVPVLSTRHFAFFSDFETNLNDALLNNGVARKFKKPELFQTGPEAQCFAKLPAEQQAAWNSGVDYYLKEVTPGGFGGKQHSIRMQLAGFDSEIGGADARAFADLARNVRAAAAPAYRACRWAAQDAANRAWLRELEPRLRANEEPIAQRLTALYKKEWVSLPIPVDIVQTVDWSGANSVITPQHLLVSIENPHPGALEVVFHEASHVLMDRTDPVRKALDDAASAAGYKLPPDLWHVVLFYTTGEVVQAALERDGAPYKPMLYAMFERPVWTEYRGALETEWKPYVEGKRDLATAAKMLVENVRKTPAVKEPPPASTVTQRIDAVLAPRLATREANGTVLVFQDGVQIYRRDIGMANFEQRQPITSKTVFRLASLTKTFTAAAAMVLRSEKKLDFAAPVAKYLPDFPRGQEIRVFHLLGHASGLGDVPDPPPGSIYHSLDEAIAAFAGQPLAFKPGTSSRYSNAGYVLSAKLVEVTSGSRYADFLRARFFTPLGMTSAVDNPAPGSVERAARLYYPAPTSSGVEAVKGSDLTSIVGAGSLLMTADDLMRWLEATRTNRFVNVWTAEYPFGWGKRTYFGGTAVEQTGRNAGFGASATIVPAHNLSTLCLFNTESGFGLRCSTEVAAAVLGEKSPQPSLSLDLPRAPFDRAAATALAGEYRSPQGWKLALRLQNDALVYCFHGDDPCDRWIPATPSTERRYLLLGDSALITVRAEEGQPLKLAYQDGGDVMLLVRVP
jgi:CubicO group peptidase (beta-lactamase class C family)